MANTLNIVNDAAVQGTNDSSIVSKCSTAERGYFLDPFLKYFVGKKKRRSPLIHRGYYIRTKAVDHVMSPFLQHNQENVKQVLSLGAGFDSSYFRLKQCGQLTNTVYYEVDFPDVCRRKVALIEQSDQLRSVLSQHTGVRSQPECFLDREDYKIIGVDMSQLQHLARCLEAAGLDKDIPTLILSEVVLTYMDPDRSSAIISWASAFSNSIFVTYEQINPHDAFGIFMLSHFDKLRSSLKSISTFPTAKAQVNRYLDLGMESCVAVDMNFLWKRVMPEVERQRVQVLEPFDEFEEWHLKCSHYILLTAFKGNCHDLLSRTWNCVLQNSLENSDQYLFSTKLKEFAKSGKVAALKGTVTAKVLSSNTQNVNTDDKTNRFTQICPSDNTGLSDVSGVIGNNVRVLLGYSENLGNSNTDSFEKMTLSWKVSEMELDASWAKRFGHRMCLWSSKHVVITGGFGQFQDRHQRLSGVILYDLQTGQVIVNNGEGHCVKQLTERLYHAMLTLSNGSVLLFGGRTSPRNALQDVCMLEFSLSCSCKSADSPSHRNEYSAKQEKSSEVNIKPCASMSTDSVSVKTITAENNVTSSKDDLVHLLDKQKSLNSTGCLAEDVTKNNPGCEKSIEDSLPRVGCYCRNVSLKGLSVKADKPSCKPDDDRVRTGLLRCHCLRNSSICSQCRCQGEFRCRTVSTRGNPPCARWRHTATLVNKSDKEFVIVFGGRNDSSVFNDIFSLETSSWTWQKITVTGQLPGPRNSHTADAWKDNILITGGLDQNEHPLSSIYSLDCCSLQICQVHHAGHLFPRYSHTSAVFEDCLFLLGGVSSEILQPGLAVISLNSFTCQEYTLSEQLTSDHVMLHNHQSVLLPDRTFLVVGGGGNCFSFGTYLNPAPFLISLPDQALAV